MTALPTFLEQNRLLLFPIRFDISINTFARALRPDILLLLIKKLTVPLAKVIHLHHLLTSTDVNAMTNQTFVENVFLKLLLILIQNLRVLHLLLLVQLIVKLDLVKVLPRLTDHIGNKWRLDFLLLQLAPLYALHPLVIFELAYAIVAQSVLWVPLQKLVYEISRLT